ncbi:tRNA(Ile)(2)-agmatinylcytidine synthase [Desulfurococcus mucosus]|uniref:tRNA(Ile2) 2-agmatinylcytidine synthetase TiaS n=1 Tax=Desulfurococcus mucosus (strain ATCC 35584 / DSM 2162 / JCM 9187 / O7/1) TaxID=765177 RepID=E8R958_DESM0|nr:tRNA(Ile)(2)-agmatinylcytidine synthase [Desulfurococcus mucosus]ADV65034.1 tRNA(Ile2) 2-agmatinylcytidine synthetase [Desulfurococcus mucosus DSM 2162]
MSWIRLHIGLDDVDSPLGGCTTHLAVRIAYKLSQRSDVEFTDYPNLIRLNPAVPWKTRGNGAVALRILLRGEAALDDVVGLVESEVEEYIAEYANPKHQPSIVFLEGDVPEYLGAYGGKALYDFIPLDYALRIVGKLGGAVKVYAPRGKRGVIGSLAAIGNQMLSGDYTYELIAYRTREYIGKPRMVDEDSIVEMDEATRGRTILNYDYESGRPLVIPRGPDPVLYGVRGETPLDVIEASKLIRVLEPIEYMAVFRTNQHTDSHLKPVGSICDVHPYMCVRLTGVVASKPRRIQGGHLVFKLCDDCCIDVAVYEPTKHFRDVVGELEPGDRVEAMGCVRPGSRTHGATLNLEKICVKELSKKTITRNPLCPVCGRRMESAGRGKGFKCRHCGFRTTELGKETIEVPRRLGKECYQPPFHVFKHVMRPLDRMPRGKVFTPSELIQPFVWKP